MVGIRVWRARQNVENVWFQTAVLGVIKENIVLFSGACVALIKENGMHYVC